MPPICFRLPLSHQCLPPKDGHGGGVRHSALHRCHPGPSPLTRSPAAALPSQRAQARVGVGLWPSLCLWPSPRGGGGGGRLPPLSLGYADVQSARTVEQAVELFVKRYPPYRVVLSDYHIGARGPTRLRGPPREYPRLGTQTGPMGQSTETQ